MLHKTELDPEKLKRIEGLVDLLTKAIDVRYHFTLRMRDLILELARYIDENQICQQNMICRIIKEMLMPKIQEGKITPRWIEESLPQEYKRRYGAKNQNGTRYIEKKFGTIDHASIVPSHDTLESRYEIPPDELTKAALLERLAGVLGMPETKVELSIPRDKYPYLRNSMEHSKDHILLVFDNTIFRYAYADTVQLEV